MSESRDAAKVHCQMMSHDGCEKPEKHRRGELAVSKELARGSSVTIGEKFANRFGTITFNDAAITDLRLNAYNPLVELTLMWLSRLTGFV